MQLVNVRSTKSEWALDPIGLVSLKEEEKAQRYTQARWSCEDGGRDEVMRLQAKEYQGLLGTTRTQKGARKDSFPESSERVWPCHCFDSELLSSRTMRK